MKKICVLVMVLLSASALANPPKVLKESMDRYVEDPTSDFISILIKGSALEGEKTVLGQRNMMSQIETFYGKPESWNVLASCPFTPRIQTTYFVIHYEYGPVYGSLKSYKKSNGNEVATNFLFHTDDHQILPYTPIEQENICED